MAASPDLKSARKRIESELDDVLDSERIREIVDVALSTKKRVWADIVCRACSKRQRHQVEVVDGVGVTKVLEVLLNQSSGRPSESHDDEHVSVEYNTVINFENEILVKRSDGTYVLPSGRVLREVLPDSTTNGATG